MLRSLATFGALAGVAATALAFAYPAAADDGPQVKPRARCAFVSQINNFHEIDDYTAIIETSPSRRFKVTFMNSCRELRWALFARVEARPGICLGVGDKIIVGRHGFRDRCVISAIEPLPPRVRQQPVSNY